MDECSFKYEKVTERLLSEPDKEMKCKLTHSSCGLTGLLQANNCPGEENCILFQIYKNMRRR